MSYVFTDNLKTAVDEWIDDPAAAAVTYGDINNWDVSKVTDMSEMFASATNFVGDISGWDVSQVTDMSNMFQGASAFDANISGWDVSQVTNMSDMFQGASKFNADISEWDVSQVTDMSNMFENASAFTGDISGWNVSQVTYMDFMFAGAGKFTADISEWNVGNVQNMYAMFRNASAFTAADISGWNVGNVLDMSYMFSGALAFTADISGWDVRNVASYDGFGISGVDPDWGKWSLQNASLSGLVVGTSTLSPAFKDSTRSYTSSMVAYSVSSITVTPTQFDIAASIKVNDTAVSSGSTSGAILLNVGSNIISVIVTNGTSTTMSYSITVTRAAPPPPPHSVYSSSSVTELVDIVDAGSGNIITDAERASIEKMSAILEDSSGIPKLSIEVGVDHSAIKTLVIISQADGPPMLYENDLVTVFANAII